MPVGRSPAAQRPCRSAPTLGDVLYANSSQALVSEKNWVRLAQSLADGRSVCAACALRAHASGGLHVDPAADEQPGNRRRAHAGHLRRPVAKDLPLRSGEKLGAGLDHEPGARQGHRLAASRTAAKGPATRVGGRIADDRYARLPGRPGVQGAGPTPARCPHGSHPGGARGDRDGVFRRAGAWRSRGAPEAAFGHDQGPDPLRLAQASGRARASRQSHQSAARDEFVRPGRAGGRVCDRRITAIPALAV